jgi:hypothetical protein
MDRQVLARPDLSSVRIVSCRSYQDLETVQKTRISSTSTEGSRSLKAQQLWTNEFLGNEYPACSHVVKLGLVYAFSWLE